MDHFRGKPPPQEASRYVFGAPTVEMPAFQDAHSFATRAMGLVHPFSAEMRQAYAAHVLEMATQPPGGQTPGAQQVLMQQHPAQQSAAAAAAGTSYHPGVPAHVGWPQVRLAPVSVSPLTAAVQDPFVMAGGEVCLPMVPPNFDWEAANAAGSVAVHRAAAAAEAHAASKLAHVADAPGRKAPRYPEGAADTRDPGIDVIRRGRPQIHTFTKAELAASPTRKLPAPRKTADKRREREAADDGMMSAGEGDGPVRVVRRRTQNAQAQRRYRNRQRTKDEYLEENADQLAARLTELQNMHRSGRVLSPASAVGKGTGEADAAMSDEELDRRLAEAKAATTILEDNLQKEKDKWSTLMQAEREAIETAMENNKDTRADLTCKLLSSVQALTVLGGGHLVGVDAIRRLDTNLGREFQGLMDATCRLLGAEVHAQRRVLRLCNSEESCRSMESKHELSSRCCTRFMAAFKNFSISDACNTSIAQRVSEHLDGLNAAHTKLASAVNDLRMHMEETSEAYDLMALMNAKPKWCDKVKQMSTAATIVAQIYSLHEEQNQLITKYRYAALCSLPVMVIAALMSHACAAPSPVALGKLVDLLAKTILSKSCATESVAGLPDTTADTVLPFGTSVTFGSSRNL